MAKFKETATRGIRRDHNAAFEQFSKEYEIPDAVLENGLAAVIEWVNKAAGPVAVLGAGALLLGAFATPLKKKGIRDNAVLRTFDRTFLLFPWQFGKMFFGNVVNDSLHLVSAPNANQEIPTRLVDSVMSVSAKKREFIVKYLDGTYRQGQLETAVLFEAREGLFFSNSGVQKIEPCWLKSIECRASAAPEDEETEALIRSV
jgi:hypothetical protein